MRVALKIELSNEQRQQLETAVRSRSLPLRVVGRAHFGLLAAEGLRNDQIVRCLSLSRFKVSRWRERFARHGFGELKGMRPGAAAPRPLAARR
jgi:hypothetical protein